MGAVFAYFSNAYYALAFSVSDTGLYETATGTDASGNAIKGASNPFDPSQKFMDAGTFLATYVVQPLFAISGIIFLAFFLYSGILWMTDQGDAKQVDKAKKIMVYSTIGLIIMLAAFSITNLVLNAISGKNLAG